MGTRSMPNCNEEIGEIICPKCDGQKATAQESYMIRCPKCQGIGKLDWCQQAVGVAPKSEGSMFFSQWDSSSVTNHKYVSDGTGWSQVLDNAIQHLANKIDEEILGSIKNDLEHNENIKLGEDLYDNREFSKLVLFPTIESEIENQED